VENFGLANVIRSRIASLKIQEAEGTDEREALNQTIC